MILFSAGELNFLSGPGRGVMAIKLGKDDRVLGFRVANEKKEGLVAYTPGGRKIPVSPSKYRVTSRAGKGVQVIKRGGLSRVEGAGIALPRLGEEAAQAAGTEEAAEAAGTEEDTENGGEE